MSNHLRELAYRIWGTCPGVPGETAEEWFNRRAEDWFDRRGDWFDRLLEDDDSSASDGDPEPSIKLPDPPDDEGDFTEPETPKVGSRDAPGG